MSGGENYTPEIETALKDLDFTGKTIRIVTTHEGSGLANVPKEIIEAYENNTMDNLYKHAKKMVELNKLY